MTRILLLITITLTFSLTGCETGKPKPAEAWVTTPDQAHLMEKTEIPVWNRAYPDSSALITIDSTSKFQEMDGFGFTLTGGSAMLLHKMTPEARSSILHELFGNKPGQLNVSYLRLSIGASDLDEKTWSYADLPQEETDLKLEKFSLAYDTLYLVPVLKEILNIQPELKLMGSPWSAPVWMKDNKDTRGGSLTREYYSAYAEYLAKYIQAMAEQGIKIDAITVQNEPLHPGNNPSMYMSAQDQAEFVRDHLGPLFENQGLNTKIIIYDHNADKPEYPISILRDPEAAKYIDGSAFHLYGGNIEALSRVHEAFPGKNIYFTEQWVGAPGDFAGELTWHTTNLIIGAPRNWARTVLEWNLAADENQDPHTDRGGCDRCLGAITLSGDQVVRNPAYYIIGQISSFVNPGSVRIASSNDQGILSIAYKTPENKVVVLLQNTRTIAKQAIVHAMGTDYALDMEAGAVVTITM